MIKVTSNATQTSRTKLKCGTQKIQVRANAAVNLKQKLYSNSWVWVSVAINLTLTHYKSK